MIQRLLFIGALCVVRIASAQPATVPSSTEVVPVAPEVTPVTLEGAETFVYREAKPDPLRVHVFKPADWKPGDRRPALVFFFGGGWKKGTPEKSAGWAKMAAKWGMVGVAPDYRTIDRFKSEPADSVADGRASLRWVQDHADELGIDPAKIVVGGSSAGGHLALWTAISAPPPKSDPTESPTQKPAALILMSALTDTTYGTYGRRAGEYGRQLSPQHHLDPQMPPTIMFHGDADKTVAHDQAANLDKLLRDAGNVSELVTVPGGSHGFSTDLPEWKEKSRAMIREFLVKQGILRE